MNLPDATLSDLPEPSDEPAPAVVMKAADEERERILAYLTKFHDRMLKGADDFRIGSPHHLARIYAAELADKWMGGIERGEHRK